MADQLKGLFGGGEAGDAPSGQAEAPAAAQGGGGRRKDGGGGRRRRRQWSPDQVAQAEDFVNRYTTGSPSEGFTSEEAIEYLQQMRGEVTPEMMQRAAVATVNNLPPDQRQAFAEMLQKRQAGAGMVTIERTGQARDAEGRGSGAAGGGGMDDMLGGLLGGLLGGGMAQRQPQGRQAPQPQGGMGMDDMLGGLLGGLLGGGMAQPAPKGGSDPFGDLLGGMLGGGMAAPEPDPRRQPQAQQDQGGGGIGDFLGSPLGKAVMGGLAAFAMKEMMGQGKTRGG